MDTSLIYEMDVLTYDRNGFDRWTLRLVQHKNERPYFSIREGTEILTASAADLEALADALAKFAKLASRVGFDPQS